MAHMTKKTKYNFTNQADRDCAETAFSTTYPHLRTSCCSSQQHGVEVFSLFVETTKSLLFDMKIEHLMRQHNCIVE